MSDEMGLRTKAAMQLFAKIQAHNLAHHPTWDQNMAYLKAIRRVEEEARGDASESPPTHDIIPETVTLDPPHPAYWRHILTQVIYNAIHHPPGGPKNVPPGQIAEAVVARLLRAAPPLNELER